MQGYVLYSDWFYRWLAIAATAMVAGIGLFAVKINVDIPLLRQPLSILLIYLAAAWVFTVLAARIGSLAFVFSACAEFFHCAAQLVAFLIPGVALTYVAASAGFPLRDRTFARLDEAMGFHWYAFDASIEPALRKVLWAAYDSGGMQLFALLLFHSMRARDDNGEPVWNVMVSLLVVTAISAFLPATGMPGMIGQHHIDVLLAVREGSVRLVDGSTIDGIVTFPSFHTAMGVICVYSARKMKWLLAALVPLNLLLIVSTLTCGGHYLVDTLAGLVVAAVTILVVRNVRRFTATRASREAPDSGTAATP